MRSTARFRDISERIAADEHSRRAYQLLQDAVDSLPHGFSVLDSDGRYAVCNRAFADVYDVKPEYLVGRSRGDMVYMLHDKVESINGDKVSDKADLVGKLTQTLGTPVEVKLKSGDWWQLVREPIWEGGISALRIDIILLKAAEETACASSAFVMRLLDACLIPFGIARVDDGFVIYESLATKALFKRGYDGNPAFTTESFKNPKDHDAYVEALRRDNYVEGYQLQFLRSDGTEFPASVTSRMIGFEGEVPRRALRNL